LLFAACEKVIIDQDNNVSLISLLQDLKVDIPEGETSSREAGRRRGAEVVRVGYVAEDRAGRWGKNSSSALR
jgi:hypothetical protein